MVTSASTVKGHLVKCWGLSALLLVIVLTLAPEAGARVLHEHNQNYAAAIAQGSQAFAESQAQALSLDIVNQQESDATSHWHDDKTNGVHEVGTSKWDPQGNQEHDMLQSVMNKWQQYGSSSNQQNVADIEEPARKTSQRWQKRQGGTTTQSSPVPERSPASKYVPSSPSPSPSDSTAPSSNQQQGSTSSTVTGTSDDSVLQGVLELHNSLRARHGTPALTWSSKLYSSAQMWADNCQFEHSSDSVTNVGPKGENLAWNHQSFNAAVQDWYDEQKGYDYQRGGFTAGHFTQLVWRSTTDLGCAYTKCSNGPLYVCHYQPPGNYNNQYTENVPPPASH